MFRKLILGVVAMALLVTPVLGDTLSYQVPSGKKAQLFSFVLINRLCQTGSNVVRIQKKPSHGTVTVEKYKHTIKDVKDGFFRKCEGKTVPGRAVTYTSSRGYHGPDTFTIYREEGVRRFWTDVKVKVK